MVGKKHFGFVTDDNFDESPDFSEELVEENGETAKASKKRRDSEEKINRVYSKMSDEKYFELFEKLKKGAEETGVIDDDIFVEIFDGKIKAIAVNQYLGFERQLDDWDREDAISEGFVCIYKELKSKKYFVEHEEGYVVEPLPFLGWCRTVIFRHLLDQVDKDRYKRSNLKGRYIPEIFINQETFKGTPEDLIEIMERQRVISEMYNTVAMLNCNVHRKLAWFYVMSNFYFGMGESKELQKVFLEKFETLPLYLLFDYVIGFLNVPGSCLAIRPEGLKKMRSQLDKVKGGLCCGETCIGDYLGAQRNVVVSKWLSDIKDMIRERMCEYTEK